MVADPLEITQDPPAENKPPYENILKSFFADKYDVLLLRNLIIDELVKTLRAPNSALFNKFHVEEIYKNTGSGSGLRKFAIETWKYADSIFFERPCIQEWLVQNPEITKDLFVAYAKEDMMDAFDRCSIGAKDYYDAAQGGNGCGQV